MQRCLSRVLSEMKVAREASGGKDVNVEEETPVPVEEWRPAKGPQVTRAIAIHRAERDARYQQAECLREQGLSTKEIAGRLGIHERTVRHWFRRGVAPDSRPRRKRQSDFDPYAAYVLKRWRDGERNGARLWQEITAQGYPGSQRMVYRFLSTLKTTEVNPVVGTQGVFYSTSRAAVCLFMQHPDTLDEDERAALSALRQAHPRLPTAYGFTQNFLQMMHQREGERLDTWLTQVQASQLPERKPFCLWRGTGQSPCAGRVNAGHQ